MKQFKKLAHKITALALAISTTATLLSPYDANATSGDIQSVSVGSPCGYTATPNECKKTTQKTTTSWGVSGSGATSWGNPYNMYGSGGYTTTTSTTITSGTMIICGSGSSKICDSYNSCSGITNSYGCDARCQPIKYY